MSWGYWGLDRHLGRAIPEYDEDWSTVHLHLPPAEVLGYANEDNSWRNRHKLHALADDIARNGMREPVIVSTDGEYALIADGHHRAKAAHMIGLPRIPIHLEHDGGLGEDFGQPVGDSLRAWLSGEDDDHHTAHRTAMPRQDAYGNNWPADKRKTEEPKHPADQVWYHRSDHDLPDGTMLVPSGGKSRWDDVYHDDDNRRKWVWMSKPDMEWFWGLGGTGKHLYEVQPEGEGPYPWNDDESQYVAPRARILRKIQPGSPEHRTAANPRDRSLDELAQAGYVTDGWREWQQGGCIEYAHALRQRYPHLGVGVISTPGDEDDWQHIFVHDGTHAYDSAGRHPLPYTGVHNNLEQHLDHDLDWYDEPDPDLVELAHKHIDKHGIGPRTAHRTAMPAHYHEEGDDGHGHLDGKWQPGDTAHFEYHCWQAPASNDYDLWQRTQQPVTVLSQTDGDDVSDEALTFMERVSEWGMPLTYHVRFGDGHEGVVTEDELHTHPKHFHPSYEFHPRNRQDGLSTPLPGYDKTAPNTAHRTAMPTWYHLTDKRRFRLDPDYRPVNYNDTPDDYGIYLTQRPESWARYDNYGYEDSWNGNRPYVAEIDAPDDLHKLPGVWHDPDATRPGDPFPGADEIFVPDHQFHHLTVQRVRPRTAMPAIDAYDDEPEFDDDYNPIPNTQKFPDEHRYSGQEIQPGPYYHATDQEFNPGDIVQSHSALHGHQGDRGNHADWVWMARHPDVALGQAGPHLYEVEPMDEGPWEWNHDIFSRPGDDGRYVSPRARVIRAVPHNYPYWKNHKHAYRTAMPAQDAYDDFIPHFLRKRETPPAQGEFFHGSDYKYQPGDILESARARGDQDRIDYMENGIGSPSQANWVWMHKHPDHVRDYGKNVYQVEPLDEGPWPWGGPRVDSWDGRVLRDDEPDDPDQEPKRYVSPRARVIRKLNNKKARIMSAAVTVYTQPNCVQCTMTKKQLDKLGIAHDTVDVTKDPDAHAYVTGLGYTAAPVVVVNNGESHWAGFRPERLKDLVSGE